MSRSAQKRLAKSAEDLAHELSGLSAQEIAALPCEPSLRDEVLRAGGLKAGARKRQIKTIAKILRRTPVDDLLLHLEKRRGSKLKKTREFQELERLRDAIIEEAIAAYRAQALPGERWEGEWESAAIAAAGRSLPDLDTRTVTRAARLFAATRKPMHAKEIFRLLKAARERTRFSGNAPE